MKYYTKILLSIVLTLLVFMGTLVFLAKSDIKKAEVGSFEYESKMFSRSLLIQGFGGYKNIIDRKYGAHLLDEDFVWEDLNDNYYEYIRQDQRLQKLYDKEQYTLEDYIAMREFLRDFFSHGVSKKKYQNSNLIELLDAAEKGEEFACGDISKMLAQMIMATGTQARLVRLSNEIGQGHVVVEFWYKPLSKWVLLDPDYNVHYTDTEGLPLNAADLYEKYKIQEKINKHQGESKNTLFKPGKTKLFEKFYSNGFAIDCYNKWVSKNLERNDPQRSPVNSCIYVGEQKGRERYYAKDFDLEDTEVLDKLYQNPS